MKFQSKVLKFCVRLFCISTVQIATHHFTLYIYHYYSSNEYYMFSNLINIIQFAYSSHDLVEVLFSNVLVVYIYNYHTPISLLKQILN